jgi:hypothetical protein
MMANDCYPGDEMFTRDMLNRLGARPTPETVPIPERTPLLEVSLLTGNSRQSVRAAQLTHSWRTVLPNGDGSQYFADSVHPLQMRDYSSVTLTSNNENGKIELQWDGYPPQSVTVTVQRWNAIYEGTGDISVLESGERIPIDRNGFAIAGDGNDYIYEVYAKWPEGYSWYAFRVDGAGREPV